MSANSERQARFKARQNALGLIQMSVWVPPGAVADMTLAAELIRANPALTIGRLTDTVTGRLVGLRTTPRGVRGL